VGHIATATLPNVACEQNSSQCEIGPQQLGRNRGRTVKFERRQWLYSIGHQQRGAGAARFNSIASALDHQTMRVRTGSAGQCFGLCQNRDITNIDRRIGQHAYCLSGVGCEERLRHRVTRNIRFGTE